MWFCLPLGYQPAYCKDEMADAIQACACCDDCKKQEKRFCLRIWIAVGVVVASALTITWSTAPIASAIVITVSLLRDDSAAIAFDGASRHDVIKSKATDIAYGRFVLLCGPTESTVRGVHPDFQASTMVRRDRVVTQNAGSSIVGYQLQMAITVQIAS